MKDTLEKLRQLWPDRIVLTWDPLNFDSAKPPYWLLVLWIENGSTSSSGSSVYVKHHEDPKILVEDALRVLQNGHLNYQVECQKYNSRQENQLATGGSGG